MLFFVLSLFVGSIFGVGFQLALGSKKALQGYALQRGYTKATAVDYPKTVAAWVVFITVIVPFIGAECFVSTLLGTQPVLFPLWVEAVVQVLCDYDMCEEDVRDLHLFGCTIVAKY